MGCIITREPTYEAPPNIPATVLDTPDYPFDEIIEIDRSLGTIGDAGVSSDLEISAIVRDPNTTQELSRIHFVDFDRDDPANIRPIGGAEAPIPPEPDSEDPTERSVRILVPISRFDPDNTCHTVQLHVSESFDGFTNQPDVEGDLGVGTWFVIVHDGEVVDRAAALADCPTNAGGGS